jgi:phosphoribosylformylglycinamidine synthase subunit PurL
MASPAIASRRWIWEQYDSQVGADTVQTGGDAAVVRIHGTRKALAMTTDCTPRYCYADPVEGGKQAVAEAYRNLCAVGARPLAITNCLNFGNPQRPEIMAQIVGCLEGMSEACLALDMPIVSGNVSLYNESKATGGGSAILPTPAIGAVGVLDDWEKNATIGLRTTKFDSRESGTDPSAALQDIWLVGEPGTGHLGQSLWLAEVRTRREGTSPPVELGHERKAGEFVRELIQKRITTAVHDVSDGGVLVTVAEMALSTGVGAELEGVHGWTTDQLFGEDQGRYVVTTLRTEEDAEIMKLAEQRGIPVLWLGYTGDDDISIGDLGSMGKVPLADLRAAHEGFFPTLMGADAALA